MDWSFVRGSAIVSAGMLIARLLGLGFSLILASVFAPEDFGHVQYTLAVAAILAIVVHPFGQHVIARFISSGLGTAAEESPEALEHLQNVQHQCEQHRDGELRATSVESMLNNAWVLFLLLLGLTLFVTLVVAWRSPDLGFELLFVVFGIALFYAYWGVSRGYMRPGRLTAAYLGSNVVQIIAVGLLIWLLEIRSTGLALAIYGLSYVPAILWMQRFYPLPLHLDLKFEKIQRSVMGQLLRFTVPITFSHGAYMLFGAADLLFLNRLVDAGGVGRYALAKTLATAFSFVPMGIATLLMPQIASTSAANSRILLVRSVLASMVINLIFLGGFWLLVRWFVSTFFGATYLASTSLYLMLALSAMMLGIQSIVAAVFVGSNQPQIETAGRSVATIFVLVGCWWLIPVYGEMGAAMSVLGGSIAALGTYAILALRSTKGAVGA